MKQTEIKVMIKKPVTAANVRANEINLRFKYNKK